MTKKYIIAALLLSAVSQCVQAKIRVINRTPWDIKFTYHWIGKLPIDGNIFNWSESNWRDSYEFEVPAATYDYTKKDPKEQVIPGIIEQSADAANIKDRYIIKTKDEHGAWKVQYDQKTSSAGDRKITLDFVITNANTGEGYLDVSDGLL